MSRIASGLLGVTALCLIVLGIERIVYWVSLPLGPRFGAGEMFGTVVGLAIVALGAGAGLTARAVWHDVRAGWIAAAAAAAALICAAYGALSTPGPPPLPLPVSIGAAVIGLALVGMIIARAARRLARRE